MQQHLRDEDNLTFYTDGSLINANTQAASISASFICISDTNNITHLFTTIENWSSSLRAELFAILLTLIVSPHGCRVDINTDSQNLINIIQWIYIIKGFIPTTLVEWLQKFITVIQYCNLLIKAFDKLYEDSLDLWKSRCEAVASVENMCRITQYMKCSISYNTKYREPYTSYNINNFSFDSFFINIESIEYINLLIRFNIAYIDLFTFDIP
ncbi:hypothetical protein RCL_jg25259.t1 [Rhizophagus clarus]|uniref:RNase H type-1 domain-containing protein n=1 Tax=Rhizophagus clarus TaxID=94130 RepID=A0A8H3QB75_9GLOM|nr:hypothetical protein RCL_jg25259.t1 [Rhizophagus clarus]